MRWFGQKSGGEKQSIASPKWRIGDEAVQALLAARHPDPFAVLGPHETPDGVVIRALVSHAESLTAIPADGAAAVPLNQRGGGFFEGLAKQRTSQFFYRLRAANAGGEWEFVDPYAMPPVLGATDDYLFVEGTHRQLYERLGAHLMRFEGIEGVHFAVWAPRARRVSVVGDFNAWDGRRHQMRKRIDSGLWEIFAPGVDEGAVYKYEIVAADGRLLPLKADPVGFSGEMRPSTASIVADAGRFTWTDAEFLESRASGDPRRKPMAIYEVHLGSWMRRDDPRFLSYDELASRLIPYVSDFGFTHIELLPISEHPLDASWGYEPIGLFAPTRRFGDPASFARFVDKAHAAGLGVILAHFPTVIHGLAQFDGEPLYEHADPRLGFHPDWNTAIYDCGRREVTAFLVANALFWLDRYHVDGLRVDAVASMLYLDYSRKPGEWLPNSDGSNDNRNAVAFLKRVNELVYGKRPGAVTIAEESTTWPGVSAPTSAGGLGFGFKWNLGFMHDTLDYMALDPVHRKWHHDKPTFGLLYTFSENFVLPLSHDEVVHGKGSLINKMPGDDWQKFANLRAYFGYMWAHPGKKLLFMGQEFAQRREWNEDRGLDFGHLEFPPHKGMQRLVRDLNRLHRMRPALHTCDCEPEGFRWIVVDDRGQSVVAFARYGAEHDPPMVMVANFTPVPRHCYRVGLPRQGWWREILNTDAEIYGGSGVGNLGGVAAGKSPSHGQPASAELTLPPLATLYFQFAEQ